VANKRLERTRHEQASLLSNLGEPRKRNVRRLFSSSKIDHVSTKRYEACLCQHTRANGFWSWLLISDLSGAEASAVPY